MKLFIKTLICIFSFNLPALASDNIESLANQLETKAKSSKSDVQTKKIMSDATETLRKSSILQSVKKVGDVAPDFNLPDIHNKKVSLATLRKNGPVVVTFYRGGWCPYCNIQLRAYQKAIGDFTKRGATLVAISPDIISEAAKTVKTNTLGFTVLTDKDNIVAKSYGLTFTLPGPLKELYKKFGIDLEKSQENNKWELPLPATYIVNSKGIIEYAFADVDYKKRAETSEILAALDKLAKTSKK